MKYIVLLIVILSLIACDRKPIQHGKIVDKHWYQNETWTRTFNYYYLDISDGNKIISLPISKECFDKYNIGDPYSEKP